MNRHSFIDRHLKERTIVSLLLSPFSFIYLIIMSIRRWLYDVIPFLSYKSKFKVISIGNITTGGTGKTPFVLYLANKLKQEGYKVAIVLRGYKGAFEYKTALIADEEKVYDIAKIAGDEAILYTDNLKNTPVCVGKNRVKSVQLLEEMFPELDCVILDDGFQYLRIRQDTKYCVFSTDKPIGNGFCLPAGILREGCSSLKYVDVFVVNGEFDATSTRYGDVKIATMFEKYGKQVLYGDYAINEIIDFNGKVFCVDELKEKNLMLLSGIGTPKSFENTVEKAGLCFERHLCLDDHFEYNQVFIDAYKDVFGKYDYVLTTEKDFTKLKALKMGEGMLVVKVGFLVNMAFPLGM